MRKAYNASVLGYLTGHDAWYRPNSDGNRPRYVKRVEIRNLVTAIVNRLVQG
ncbi:MAG: hypothetical protein P0120_00250 [Nitrospira sp.]|nr:hypothetical protein [Nitrospira sp.]